MKFYPHAPPYIASILTMFPMKLYLHASIFLCHFIVFSRNISCRSAFSVLYVAICLCFSWHPSSWILICLWLLNCVFSWISIVMHLHLSQFQLLLNIYLPLDILQVTLFRARTYYSFFAKIEISYVLRYLFPYFSFSDIIPKHHEYDACNVLWNTHTRNSDTVLFPILEMCCFPYKITALPSRCWSVPVRRH